MKSTFEYLCSFLNRLLYSYHYENAERLLRLAVYVWCLLWVAVMLPVADQVWGPNAYIIPISKTPLGEEIKQYRSIFILDLLSSSNFANLYFLFVFGFVMFCVCCIFNKLSMIAEVGVLILFHVLMLKAHAVEDGGDRLMTQFLFYLALLSFLRNKTNAHINLLKNLTFLSIKMQICLTYWTAALSKMTGKHWVSGDAIYYILHVDQYTLPWVVKLSEEHLVITALIGYLVLGFQLSFPFLAWQGYPRKLVLLCGALIHIQIVFVMGIVSFGLAMIVGYFSFYTETEAQRFLKRLCALAQLVQSRKS